MFHTLKEIQISGEKSLIFFKAGNDKAVLLFL